MNAPNVTASVIPANPGPFGGAGRVPLSQQLRTVPQMEDAINEWLRPAVVATQVPDGVVDGIPQFREERVRTAVFVEPLKARSLEQKPEGMRAWSWFRMITDRRYVGQVNDRISIDGVKYRVLGAWDYERYGFKKYEIVLGYQE